MTTSYTNPIPAGYSAATLDSLFASVTAEADSSWDAHVKRYVPHELSLLLGEYLLTEEEPSTSPTKAVITNGDSITLHNSAGANVGPATAVVAAGVLVATLPATKAVVANAASVVVNDNAGTPNAKSPGVAEVALGVVTDIKLAA
jgi:hypothetical protein